MTAITKEQIDSGDYTQDDILDYYDNLYNNNLHREALKKLPQDKFDEINTHKDGDYTYTIGTKDGVSVIIDQKGFFGRGLLESFAQTQMDAAETKTKGMQEVGQGIKNFSEGTVFGLAKAYNNAKIILNKASGGRLKQFEDIVNAAGKNFLDIDVKIPIESLKPEANTLGTMGGEITGQYIIPGAFVYKYIPNILLAEPVVVGLFSGKDDGNLASAIKEMAPNFAQNNEVAKIILDGLSVDAEDSEVEARIKNVVADAPIGILFGGLFSMLKYFKRNPDKLEEVQNEYKDAGAAATPEEQKKNFTYQGFKVDPETDEFKLQQGLPKNVKTKEDLLNLKNQVDTLTVEGDAGKFWYEKSGQKILQSVQGDKLEAEKIIKLIALYSSNAAPTPNTAAALKAYYQFLDGKPINAGMGALDKKATALLYEGKDFAGYKVNNFYNNLMMEVDPSKVNQEAITTDRWILRAFDYETTGNPTQPQINFIETTINEIAEQRNLTPYQVQAAIWASIRAGRDPKKIAELAGDDFELAINKNLGQISWETAPGAKYNFFPEYQSADASVKAEYHFDLTKAISDDSGVDLIAKRLGLITPDQFNTAGVYQNSLGELEFNPGTQTQFVAPVATGSGNVTLKGGFEARSAIDPSAKEIIEAYAYIKGKLLNQEAVAYHRPVYNAQKQLSNGLEIKYDLSNDELKNLTIALNEEFSNFPGFVVPIGSPDGFRLIINPDVTGYSITDFQTKAYNAINKTINVEDKDVIAFSTNSGYVDIDDYKFEKFESGSEEPSDLYRKISSILSELQPRVEEVYKKYETEYGWSR